MCNFDFPRSYRGARSRARIVFKNVGTRVQVFFDVLLFDAVLTFRRDSEGASLLQEIVDNVGRGKKFLDAATRNAHMFKRLNKMRFGEMPYEEKVRAEWVCASSSAGLSFKCF